MQRYVRSAGMALPPVRRLIAQRDRLAATVARERDRNAQLQHQLDQLRAIAGRAGVASGGAAGTYRYLFVVTYGRSGSTLLQGILNAIPGYLIRGENAAALYHLYKFHQTAAQRAKAFVGDAKPPVDPTHPWFGMHEYAEYISLVEQRNLITDTLLRPEPDTRVLGFKEVRWYWKDTDRYVAWLQRVFPGARFLFNTRSHAAVARSKWWAERPEALAEIERIEALQLAILDGLGDAGFRVHYDDYVADPSVLAGLYAWLGEEFDLAAVEQVMATRHSY